MCRVFMTRLWFLALAIAWSVDGMVLFALAEARWGSVLFRFFAIVLMGASAFAFTVALGPAAQRAMVRLTTRLVERHPTARAARPTVIPAPLATRAL